MHGPKILAASMSVPHPTGTSKALWQYHSRSDRHSKVACWGVLFDLMLESALLRNHVAQGKVIFGLNHEIRDFKQNRKKDLDLVIARPATGGVPAKSETFKDLADRYDIVLDSSDRAALVALPALVRGPVGGLLIALEAKAAMTAHSKARPRLYDELNSSHSTVHGNTTQALAVGLVMVNASTTFVSPSGGPLPNKHRQPAAALTVIEKVKEIPRRSAAGHDGYDGLGIVVIDCANDGSPVHIVSAPPAPPPSDIFSYASMISRVASEYDTRFSAI